MTNPVRMTGATRLYAIIGDPIAQVRSPEVFTGRFADAGLDAVMLPIHVPAASFAAVIPALLALGNLDGLLVTVPFKAQMLPFANRLGPAAACIGALNALRREADGSWSGDMFDGAGFVRGAQAKGAHLTGRQVLQFGAGGAGSAIACALVAAGVASIRLVDPDARRIDALAAALQQAFPGCDVGPARQRTGIDMIVNASPVGMRPDDGLPGAIPALTADTLVGDVVVTGTPTALIREAQRRGSMWVDGRDMHAGQIEAITGFFRLPSPTGAAAAATVAAKVATAVATFGAPAA